MDLFNIICGVSSIAGLLVSIFTASKVVKITQIMHSNNVNSEITEANILKDTTIHGSYTGRDRKNEHGRK